MIQAVMILDNEVRALEIEQDENEKECIKLGDEIATIQEINQSKKQRISEIKRAIAVLEMNNKSSNTTIVADESCEVYKD